MHREDGHHHMLTFRATGPQIMEMQRVARLVYGHYAWAGLEVDQKVEEAGSGIFVAPGLGLTAKHVTKSFFKLDPQYDAVRRRSTPLDSQYRVIKKRSEFGSLAYQTTYKDAQVNWLPKVSWPSHDTDIECMVLEPQSDGAIAVAPMLKFYEWSLHPPKLGSVVTVYGWPGQEITVHANGEDLETHDLAVELRVDSAYVTEYCPVIKEHGWREFPGFVLDRELPHGLSGGPVLQNGRLIGIFTGPDYVSSLWPLELMTYPDANDIERSFHDLFESGTIQGIDWDAVNGRVARMPCHEALAGSDVTSRCDKMHVVLK